MNRVILAGPMGTLARLAACSMLIVAAGCAGPQANENFYALNDGGVVVSTPATAASRSVSMPGIVISAVTVPELVDRPQIVTRDNLDQVIVSEQHLWAEPVRSGVGRILATSLARTMQAAGKPVQVAAYPQTSISTPYLRITVDIVRFDAVPNGEAIVDALWSIRRVADNSVQTGRTTASSPIAGVGYAAIVAAWNQALGAVGRDIGANVSNRPLPTDGAGS